MKNWNVNQVVCQDVSQLLYDVWPQDIEKHFGKILYRAVYLVVMRAVEARQAVYWGVHQAVNEDPTHSGLGLYLAKVA